MLRRHKIILAILAVFKLLDSITTHYAVGSVHSQPYKEGWRFTTFIEQSWYYAYWIQHNIWIGHITTYLAAVGYAVLVLYARRKTLTLWEKQLGRGRSYRIIGLVWDMILAGFTAAIIYTVANNIYVFSVFCGVNFSPNRSIGVNET